jgi:hypothetical protein
MLIGNLIHFPLNTKCDSSQFCQNEIPTHEIMYLLVINTLVNYELNDNKQISPLKGIICLC